MARAMWKGSISFGLVVIPVSLYSASAPGAELDLDMLDSRDGARIRYQRVNERTGKEVPWKSITKGYLVDDEYVILTPEDFKRAAEEVVRGIEIVEFVPRESISPLSYDKPYYLAPGKGGEKAYALFHEALEKGDQVGIAKAVIHTRQHLAMVMPLKECLALVVLRFPEELRTPADLELKRPAKGKISAREVEMAQELMKGMSAKWEPDKHHDEYTAALRKFIEEKAKRGGKPAPKPAEDEDEAPASYNIMDLLKRSVEMQQKTKSARRASTRKAPKTRKKAG